MRIPFRQGIVSVQPDFLQIRQSYVTLAVTNSPIVLTFASGSTDYLWSEKDTVQNAWGPIIRGQDYWLYWDIDSRTAERTFGFTLFAPVVGLAPASPQVTQHWYDTSTSLMKVWAGTSWQVKNRVFACKLVGGTVPLSVSANSPSFIGTQAGDNTVTYTGHILFDALNLPVKATSGKFITTENSLRSVLTSTADVKLASVLVEAIALQPLARYTIVKFSDFGQIVAADATTTLLGIPFGIIESDVVVGNLVNVVTGGTITNLDWDWTAAGVNALLYCNANGVLGLVPNLPSQQPVAVVIGKHSIQLGSPSINVYPIETFNTTVAANTMSDVVAGVARLNIPAVVPSSPVVVGANDPRLYDARVPLSHTHIISDVVGLPSALAGTVQLNGSTMTGSLLLNANPIAPLGAATKQYVDASVIPGIPVTGGTMTGSLILNADPITVLGAATKQYVDLVLASSVPLTGGLMTGLLSLSGNPVSNLGAATKQYVDNRVLKSGDTMTGELLLSGSPVSLLAATTKQYVTDQDALQVAKTGSTMTGLLLLSGDPVVPLGAVTKQYVDRVTGVSGVVTSVNTRSGTVVLTATDIGLTDVGGYFSTKNTEFALQFLAARTVSSTDAVPEGTTNLYFTTARVRSTALTGLSVVTNAVITATDTVLSSLGKLQAQVTAGPSNLTSTDALTEGTTNLYFTNPRVRATVLTGLSLGTATAVTAADTVLSSLGKLQAQVTAIPVTPSTTDALTEGTTNLYFTAARVRATTLTGLSLATATVIAATDTVLTSVGKLQAQITAGGGGPATTDALTEGTTNLYFTSTRVRATTLTGLSLATATVIAATDTVLTSLGKLQAQVTAGVGPATTDALTEGTTNLYFTAARVRATTLTGLSTASAVVVSATDTVLSSVGKLQAQITALPGGGSVTGTNIVFSATQASGQVIPGATLTKVIVSVKEFDTISSFDFVTNYRYQPSTTGYYQISGAVAYTSSTSVNSSALLYKNGTLYRQSMQADTAAYVYPIDAIVYMNGTTDYIEMWTYTNSGRTTDQTKTFFQGALIGAVQASAGGLAFGAYQSSSQTLATTVFTKIQLQTIEFDTTTSFDNTTNYRFQPKTAGYYQINGAVTLGAGSTNLMIAMLYKNGTRYKDGSSTPNIASGEIAIVSTIIFLNGSTDYVELYAYHSNTSSLNTTANINATYLNGVMVSTSGAALGSTNVFTRNQSVTPGTLTSGATIAIDASVSNVFKLVLGVNAILSNPTNATDGMIINIRIKQDATGSRTLTYGTVYKWPGGVAPSLSTLPNSVDLISMQYDSTDVTWICVMQKAFS